MSSLRPYDLNSPLSIEQYSKKLIGKTFAQILAEDTQSHIWESNSTCSIAEDRPLYAKERNKGGLGQIIEKYYFHYEPNSNPSPDFEEAGVELKVTPYRINKNNNSISAKERLIINMIDYMQVVNEPFYQSHFWLKARLILLIYYLHQQEIENRLDYRIEFAQLFTPPAKYLPTIIHDYELIISKIKEGKAHEISGSDTDYLEAAPKSSDSSVRRAQPFSSIPAKPRAFAFKTSFMTHILNEYIVPNIPMIESLGEIEKENGRPLEECVVGRIGKYIGYTESELVKEFNLTGYSKNKLSRLIFKILGVSGNQIKEFEMAGIVVKTIRIEENGRIKENMSFPTFKFKELVAETWETSVFGNYLRDTRFFFAVYKKNQSGEYVLKGGQFWNMPYEILENNVQKVWSRTQQVLREGLKIDVVGGKMRNNFPKIADDPVCHVRPHAQDANDTYELPDGRSYPKQCFWLSSKFIASQLKKEFFE